MIASERGRLPSRAWEPLALESGLAARLREEDVCRDARDEREDVGGDAVEGAAREAGERGKALNILAEAARETGESKTCDVEGVGEGADKPGDPTPVSSLSSCPDHSSSDHSPLSIVRSPASYSSLRISWVLGE